MESPDLVSHDQPALGVCLNETDAPLDEGVWDVSPSNVKEVGMGAPSRVVTTPTPPPKPTSVGPSRKQMPDQVMVSTYVSPLERVPPSTNMMASDFEDVLKLIRRWSPFN